MINKMGSSDVQDRQTARIHSIRNDETQWNSVVGHFVSFLTSIYNCDFDFMMKSAHNASAKVNEQKAYHVLKQQVGLTQDGARGLLCKYNFPYGGRIFNAYTFAQHISQKSKVPTWAKRFQRVPLYQSHTEKNTKAISVSHPDFPEHKIDFHLGKRLDSWQGWTTGVFLDADDSRYVIKTYYSDDRLDDIKYEAEMFQCYYGKGSAQILYGDDGKYYLRMYKVPGEKLYELPKGSWSTNDIKDMYARCHKAGITKDQYCMGSILWDSALKMCNPIAMRYFKQIELE